MPLTVADIMTSRVIKLTPAATLKDAHQLTRDKGIRHLPVVDGESGKLLAVVTQKSLLSRIIHLLTLYGVEELDTQEGRTDIMEVAETQFDSVHVSDDIETVAQRFLENRHGCLPVLDDKGALAGIVTSSDFVNLSIRLLKDHQS